MSNTWQHLLINGNSKQIEVLEPEFEKGKLKEIKGLRPFDKKDEEGKPLIPTVEDANTLKRQIYIEFFKKPIKNLIVLSGAGSSIDVGGPSMARLWDIASEKYLVKNGDKIKEDGFELICKTVNFKSDRNNLEALLTQIDGILKFAGDKSVQLNGKAIMLSTIKKDIFEVIRTHCSISRPKDSYPHKVILEKLLQRKQTNPRIKVFTLNYDLLFEYAATEVNAIVIDGFSFTFPRTFSGRLFDYDIVQREGSKLQEEDNFIQRVFHLHKLHGSLNWERDTDDNKVYVKESPLEPLMVYPRDAKYEDSYEQPYFEMMARFQRSLRLNTDTLLLCIGYSFNDKHINAALEEALNQNPCFRLAVVNPNFDGDNSSASLKEIKAASTKSERILMVSETFTDFANTFPEIRTYEADNYVTINLKNEQAKD